MLLNDIGCYPNKVNWASLIRDELYNLGFNNVWQAQSVGNINKFLSILKTRLKDQFIQNWNARINESSRATFYQAISDFKLQPYLNIVNVQKFRIALSKLRVSSHRLEIEAGRRSKPNKTHPKTENPQTATVLKMMFHFLFECTLFSNLRTTYFKP